ncbi:hypothetical protein ACA910_000925 [Epithemia clementina (nom. ined.)]
MVFYELVLTSKPHVPFWRLTEMMKEISHEIVKGGGLVRAIHNHGVRDFPQRFKARHTDQLGQRYFEKGRFISVYMDCNPQTRLSVQNILALDEDILRQTHLLARSNFEQVYLVKENKNPFVKQYLKLQAQQEEEQRQAQQQQHAQQQQPDSAKDESQS